MLGLELDVVVEREMKEKGVLGVRRTKLVCTIGPACCSFEALETLALRGMNVARLSMGHNTRDWHRDVLRKVKRFPDDRHRGEAYAHGGVRLLSNLSPYTGEILHAFH